MNSSAKLHSPSFSVPFFVLVIRFIAHRKYADYHLAIITIIY